MNGSVLVGTWLTLVHARTRSFIQVDQNPFRLFEFRGVDLIAAFGAKSGECAATQLVYPFPVVMAGTPTATATADQTLAIMPAGHTQVACALRVCCRDLGLSVSLSFPSVLPPVPRMWLEQRSLY